MKNSAPFVRIALSLLTLLLFVPPLLHADDWTSIVVNHEEQFVDGSGTTRSLLLPAVQFRGSGESAQVLFNMTIDGQKRTVAYGRSGNQTNIIVMGSSDAERISLAIIGDGKIEGGRKGGNGLTEASHIWIMSYGKERLFGAVNGGGITALSGTDPISFAALSFNPIAVPGVLNDIRGASGGAGQEAASALRILGGIFGPKIGGGAAARCHKKKVTSLKCNATCAQTAEGCPCECLGMPCCSDCTKTEETVWEYSVGATIG